MSQSDLATSDQVKILELKVKIRERKITFLEKALAKVTEEKNHITRELKRFISDSEKFKQCQICLSEPLSRKG